MREPNRYTVRYQFGTYSGELVVYAEDAEQALSRAKRTLRPHMTLPMAYESWSVEPTP